MATRRFFIGAVGLAAVAAALGWRRPEVAGATETFAVAHSDEEWRKLLRPDQYAVLRQAGTETPFTSPLLHEERRGLFACAGCDLDLFSSTTKFDSGTGWPSFWAPIDKAVRRNQGHEFLYGQDGGVLQSLRRPSRPRLRRRSQADGASLLHERPGDDVQAGERLSRAAAPSARSPDRSRRRRPRIRDRIPRSRRASLHFHFRPN